MQDTSTMHTQPKTETAQDVAAAKALDVPVIKPAAERAPLRARIADFSFFYAYGTQAIKNVTMPILDRQVTAIIDPSGCGNSTLLRSLNRMHDLCRGNR